MVRLASTPAMQVPLTAVRSAEHSGMAKSLYESNSRYKDEIEVRSWSSEPRRDHLCIRLQYLPEASPHSTGAEKKLQANGM